MPTLFKRSNGIYYAILSDEPGRRKWVSTGERRRNLALKKISTLQPDLPQQTKSPKLSEFYREFVEFAGTVYSRETVGIYRRAFNNLTTIVGDIPLGGITQRHVDLFRSRRLTQVQKVTVNIELRTLRAAFFTAVRWKMLDENPFKQVKLCHLDDTPPLYFSVGEFCSLLSEMDAEWLRDIVVVAALTGMRRGELLNLQWDTVDFNRRAGNLLAWAFLVFVSSLMVIGDGLHDIAAVAIAGILVVGSLVLHKRHFFAFCSAAFLTVTFIAFLDMGGQIASVFSARTDKIELLDILFILGITGASVRLLSANLVKSPGSSLGNLRRN